MALKIFVAVAMIVVLVEAQRPFYAGLRPIGMPQVESDPISNRFGEDADLPVLAQGDGNLINRLNSMPIDKQPFWYINWRAYEAQRNRPQTYPLKPNNFINYKMAVKIIFVVTLMSVLTRAQRPFYAGLRPIGYPEIQTNPSRTGSEDPNYPLLGPGDAGLTAELEKLPTDQQPFWYLNAKAYNELRNNPQTYPLKPNPFIDPNPSLGGK
ncbi:uncharacterized protein [Epargyreus clarus]|uniref:uncharacterized protein n=1 Tax=Epargyreus clarus TaxID=520877 RepID=UPI003C2F386C